MCVTQKRLCLSSLLNALCYLMTELEDMTSAWPLPIILDESMKNLFA